MNQLQLFFSEHILAMLVIGFLLICLVNRLYYSIWPHLTLLNLQFDTSKAPHFGLMRAVVEFELKSLPTYAFFDARLTDKENPTTQICAPKQRIYTCLFNAHNTKHKQFIEFDASQSELQSKPWRLLVSCEVRANNWNPLFKIFPIQINQQLDF